MEIDHLLLAAADRQIAAHTEALAYLETVRADIQAAEQRRQAEIADKREKLEQLAAELAELENAES